MCTNRRFDVLPRWCFNRHTCNIHAPSSQSTDFTYIAHRPDARQSPAFYQGSSHDHGVLQGRQAIAHEDLKGSVDIRRGAGGAVIA
jgi:hypothetical protein